MYRICSKCLKKGKRQICLVRERADSGQSIRKRAKTGSEGASRARLTIKQKMEVLRLLDLCIAREGIADRFGCAVRTVRKIKAEREGGEGGCYSRQRRHGDRCQGDFSHLLTYLRRPGRQRSPSRAIYMSSAASFGRSAKTTLLNDATTSADLREKLNDFKAGERWATNFVKRNGLHSSQRSGEAGSVDTEGIKEKIEETKDLSAKFQARRIFNDVGETGIQWKVMPRRTYLGSSENRKTARGSKGMTLKDRLSVIVCCNVDSTAKVYLAIIGKSKELRCLRRVEFDLPNFSRANAWTDTTTFLKWWCL